jgi:DNA repair protein RadD
MKTLRPYQQEAIKECWESLNKNNHPVLLMASVGAGKSLMIAHILLKMQLADKRTLCLVNNSELIRNNHAAYVEVGGKASIYCASLGIKDVSSNIIFGSPQSVLNGINRNESIADIKFNLIIVDEAHTINFNNEKSCFVRILRHYKHQYPDMRLLGATGTNFRFKGTPIVGGNALFKTQIGNITTEWLIENNYLIKPEFEVDKNLLLDFSKVKIKSNGMFDQKQLEDVVSKSSRLTELICKQIIHIMESQNRFGIFIFATTKKHAYEILGHLPPDESAIILGETLPEDRTRILNNARSGFIKYLVNIAIISVGVDVPAFDTLAYLRPTESLVLLIQTMGRVLRLSPLTGKYGSLVLDFAGNIERHQDWDNPILLEAIKKGLDKDKPLVILCPACNQMNADTARRCVGKVEDKRCAYYFEFKECQNSINGIVCNAKNDIVARECHACKSELIDPNAKLSLMKAPTNVQEVTVLEAKYGISGTRTHFRINCAYRCADKNGRVGSIFEYYSPVSEKAQRVFYGQFVKKHLKNSSKWYPHLYKRNKVEEMLQEVETPARLLISLEGKGVKIKKKYFYL